jgi:hypothetical protein
MSANLMVARGHVALGDTARGRKELEALLQTAERTGNRSTALEVRLALGRADLADGRRAEGLGRLSAVEREARSLGAVAIAEKAKSAVRIQKGGQEPQSPPASLDSPHPDAHAR